MSVATLPIYPRSFVEVAPDLAGPPAALQFPLRSAIVAWSNDGLAGLRDVPPTWLDLDSGTVLPQLTIPSSSSDKALLLDFGRKTAGHLQLSLEKVRSAQLEVRSGPVLGLIRF